MPESTVEEILERTTAYYESFLWESDIVGSVRSRLLRVGIEESILRSFDISVVSSYFPDYEHEIRSRLAP